MRERYILTPAYSIEIDFLILAACVYSICGKSTFLLVVRFSFVLANSRCTLFAVSCSPCRLTSFVSLLGGIEPTFQESRHSINQNKVSWRSSLSAIMLVNVFCFCLEVCSLSRVAIPLIANCEGLRTFSYTTVQLLLCRNNSFFMFSILYLRLLIC